MSQQTQVLTILPSETNRERILPAVAYLASLRTAVSKRGQISALNRVADVVIGSSARKLDRAARAQLWQRVDWTTLNAPAVRAIMARIAGAPATRNKILSALKGVARMAWEDKRIDTDTYQRIRELRGDPGLRLPVGRHVAQTEISKLLDACLADETPAGTRDAAIIALMVGTGLRREEICVLQMGGLDLAQGALRVIGKRNKERMVYIGEGTIDALRDWLKLRGAEPGSVFYAISKAGRLRSGRPLSTISVNRILRKRALQAGLEDLATPHDFRRTFISNLLDAGGDVVTVAAIAGHAKVETTQKYDRRGERAKQRVAALVQVPYRGRR